MKTKDLILIALFAALTATSAILPPIPNPLIPSVPFTLQVFFVLLAGVLLGSWRGAASMLIYLGLGVIGAPVFAGGTGGLGVILGPTGGYLVGFIFAAGVVGAIVNLRPQSGFAWSLIAMIGGIAVIHAFGIPYFAYVAKAPIVAVLVGSWPFFVVDLFKAVVAASLANQLRTALIEAPS